MDSNTRKPAVALEVFQASTGDFHAALVNRRGRLLWQSGAHATQAAAQARGECERTARYLRSYLGAEPSA